MYKIHVHIFKTYPVCVCTNIHSTHTHIYIKKKCFLALVVCVCVCVIQKIENIQNYSEVTAMIVHENMNIVEYEYSLELFYWII